MTPEELKAAMDAAYDAGDVKAFARLKREYDAGAPAKKGPVSTEEALVSPKGTEYMGGLSPDEEMPAPIEQLGYSLSQGARGALEFPQVVGLPAFAGAAPMRAEEAQYERAAGVEGSVVDRDKTLLESLGPALSMVATRNPGTGALQRFGSAVGINAALGAASPADTAEDQQMNALFGGTVGGLFQGGPELWAGAKNLAWSRQRKATGTNTYKEGLRLEQKTGIPLGEGARSLDPQTLKLEAEALGREKEAFIQNEVPLSLRYFNRIADKMDPAGIPDSDLIMKMTSAFNTHVDNLAMVRRTAWLQDEANILAEAGNKPLFYPDKLTAELQNLSEEILKISPKIKPEEAAAFQKDLDKIMRQGGVKVDDVERLLEAFTANSASTGAVLRDLDPKMARVFGAKLKTALKEDIEAAIKADPNNKALVMLNEARERYAKNSEPINALEGTALEKWFGKDGHKTPETVLQRLSNLPPSDVEMVTQLMDRIDPNIMQQARSKFISQSIDRAYNAKRAATDPEYKLTELVGVLEKDYKHFNAMFPDPTVRAEIKDGIDAVRRLASGYHQRLGPGEAAQLRGQVQSIGFLSPSMAGARIVESFTPGMLSELFFTPEGRKIITQLSVPNPSWQQRAAAASGLIRIYQENKK